MFYIKNTETGQTVRESSTPFNIDESIQPPAPHIQLKRVENLTAPAYDAATQKLEIFSTDDDTAKTRSFTYRVVNKTQAEIDSYAQYQNDKQDLAAIKLVYVALKNGTGTAAERIARLEKSVAYLLKDSVRNG